MSSNYDYNLSDLKKAIKQINLKPGDNIYVSCNLSNLGFPNLQKKNLLPDYIYNYLLKEITTEGTIIFPTHTFFENNTKKIFDPKKTKSMSGSFSNYILHKKNVCRSLHPLASIGAIGKNAKFICSKNVKNCYGRNSPFDMMNKIDVKFISIGIKYNLNCSQVHFLEYKNKVPYRFLKKIVSKVKKYGKIKKSLFYIYVLKKKFRSIERDRNNLIFRNFLKYSKIKTIKLGQNYIYAYDFNKFFKTTDLLMKKNNLCWLGKKNASL